MNILIAYSSRTGTVKICASLLGRELNTHSVTYADLETESPDPSKFDAVILGTSIRMAKAGKGFRSYISNYKNKLEGILHGFFLCCAESAEDELLFYQRKNIPSSLLESSFANDYFGGELSLDRAKGFDKILIRMIRSSYSTLADESENYTKKTLPTIAEPVIAQYADKLKAELTKRTN